jgi:hypothetical protein
MSIITGLTAGKGREKRVNVFLDGRPAFNLLAEVALKEGLRVGQAASKRWPVWTATSAASTPLSATSATGRAARPK